MTMLTGPDVQVLADVDAERVVVGSMMASPDVAADVLDVVEARDFYDPRHTLIVEAIASRVHRVPTDPVAMASHLVADGLMSRVGGPGYLSEVAAAEARQSATWYAEQVAGWAYRRRVDEVCTRGRQRAYNTETPVEDVIDAVQADIHAATVRRDTDTASQRFDGDLDDVLERLLHPDPDRGLSTGLGSLDDQLGRLRPGQLIVVAGRPAMGKSVLAVDIARAVAFRQHESVLMCSLEMSREELQHRILAAEADVDLAHIVKTGCTDDDHRKLRTTGDRLRGSLLEIDDTPGQTVSRIRTRARRLQQTVGLSLIVVDYLQQMQPDHRSDNRAVEVGEISRGLKILAKELGVPVVACAQLNRLSESRSDKRPVLSDLRESGSIEQDADVIVLLHRESYYDPDTRPGEADFIVAKHRNGATGTVAVAAQLHKARFVDMGVPAGPPR